MPDPLDLYNVEHLDMEVDVFDELTDRLSVAGLDNDSIEIDIDTDDYLTTQEASFDGDIYFASDENPLVARDAKLHSAYGGLNEDDKHLDLPSNVHCVAFSSQHQRLFEVHDTPWGVQWQIARLTTTYPDFSWSNVTSQDIAESSNTDARAIPQKLLSKAEFQNQAQRERLVCPPPLLLPWAEYVAEEQYIKQGYSSDRMNEYGGKVQQPIYLRIIKASHSSRPETVFNGFEFRFVLGHPVKSKSCRFSRRLGSRRLIQCHISKRDLKQFKKEERALCTSCILDFFKSKKLLILGRLYQGFYGHKGTIELMEINEDFGRDPNQLLGDLNRISFQEFIAWHNNVSLNGKQTLGKWSSRFALGFSTSLVGIAFSPYSIHFIKDLYAPGVGAESAASHQIMTDGCGFLNLAALQAIQQRMKWAKMPTHVQARIAGAKGLFLLDPDHLDPNERPQIWIRSSQTKVKLTRERSTWSPFHRVLDICSGPFLQHPSSITYEMILCLSAGGVPDEVLANLLRQGLQELAVDPILFDLPHSSQILWDTTYNTHRVLQDKLRQIVSPENQRAHGLVLYGKNDEIDPEDAVSAKWDVKPDPYSGAPASKQEQVLGWLEAGFNHTDPWVMQGLVYLQEKMINLAVTKYRITIHKSVRAHIVPDPVGVLAEGEIFFASSQTPLDLTGSDKHCVTGPVIVSRNPCVQMTDARKVLAVNKHELRSRGYYDVIVFSTKGSCSLASMLGGGDYDGDNVVMIWDENITNNFTNSSDLSSVRPTAGFEGENFDKSQVILENIVADSRRGRHELEPQFREALLRGAVEEKLEGLYNCFYRISLYKNGPDHADTIRLGHMYTQCLDSTKSGLVVKGDVLEADSKKWNRKMPKCFAPDVEKEESNGTILEVKRNPKLPPFILETLQDVAKQEAKAYKDRLCILKDKITADKDVNQDLVQPLKDAEIRARRFGFQDDLSLIRSHVENYRKLFYGARGDKGDFAPGKRLGKKKEDVTIGDRQESARAVSEGYNLNLPTGLQGFDDHAVSRIAASYAYLLDENGWGDRYNFCFDVAWARLCAIKAEAKGNAFTSLAPGYMDSMSMSKKIAKRYREEMEVD